MPPPVQSKAEISTEERDLLGPCPLEISDPRLLLKKRQVVADVTIQEIGGDLLLTIGLDVENPPGAQIFLERPILRISCGNSFSDRHFGSPTITRRIRFACRARNRTADSQTCCHNRLSGLLSLALSLLLPKKYSTLPRGCQGRGSGAFRAVWLDPCKGTV